ncbi:MAG TPA: hypothetical protein VOA41_11335 [Candidatus Dormibacteraeota bacterium]|nr:hypothetical protein [Candidatus Dormibacteraeota bacterium]
MIFTLLGCPVPGLRAAVIEGGMYLVVVLVVGCGFWSASSGGRRPEGLAERDASGQQSNGKYRPRRRSQ